MLQMREEDKILRKRPKHGQRKSNLPDKKFKIMIIKTPNENFDIEL